MTDQKKYPEPKEFWAGKRVCVTGGDGFLGSFVQEVLRERGATEIFIPLIEDYDLTLQHLSNNDSRQKTKQQ